MEENLENKMYEIKENNQKRRTSHNGLLSFLTAVILCCIFWGVTLYLHDGHIANGQQKIINTYVRQMKRFEAENNVHGAKEWKDEKELEKFHQEVKTLLELEFNRVQNEFEALEIWAGILTVIFLIFSFYSLFKTEQLENQSRDGMAKIRNLNIEGQNKLDLFDSNSKSKLAAIDNSIEDLKNKTTEKLNEIIKKGLKGSVSEFDTTAKELLTKYKIELDDLISKHKLEIKKEYDMYAQKLQENLDKENDSSDNREDEFDEEELKRDKDADSRED